MAKVEKVDGGVLIDGKFTSDIAIQDAMAFLPSEEQTKNFWTKIKEKVPDQLDLDCDVIFEALKKTSSSDPKEHIGLLEQCIDYLRMDLYSREEE